MERVTRIELALSAWEADVLPLNYTRAGEREDTGPRWGPVARPDIVSETAGCELRAARIRAGTAMVARGILVGHDQRASSFCGRAAAERMSCSQAQPLPVLPD